MSSFLQSRKTLIGMAHLAPLPGTVHYTGIPFDQIVEQAVADARTLAAAGFDAVMIQNTHDVPSTATAPPDTVAFLTAVGREIRRAVNLPLGVNIHKNDAAGALAVAAATGAVFVRVKVYVGAVLGPEGVVEPAAPVALRTRQRLGSQTEIWADLFDLTSVPLVNHPIGQLAHWAAKFGDAAAVIVTGQSFAQTVDYVRQVRAARPDLTVVIGGGVKEPEAAEALAAADAVIVGSALEERPFTGPVSPDKARRFAATARGGLA